MYIKNLNIIGFGKFKNHEVINFTDGLNVVCGNNEAGKTTTHTFIKSMLFGMKKKKVKTQIDTYTKYLPMEADTSYEGTLDFCHDGNEYQIHRQFKENKSILTIKNLRTGRELNDPERFLSSVLCDLSIDAFDNTISIGQLKSQQDSSMVQDLHRYIANLNTSGNMSINTVAALNFLKRKKEALLTKVKSDAAMIYNRHLGNIRNVEKELSNKNFENHIPEIVAKKEKDAKKIEENNKEIARIKEEIATGAVRLESFGFITSDDVDSLSVQTERIYLEYSPLMNETSLTTKYLMNGLFIIIGIIMVVFAALLLVVTYPDLASILKLNNLNYSLNGLANFILGLPFHPIILISILLCLGIIIMIGNALLLIFNIQNKNKAEEIKNILSDIFNQHINDDYVTPENMKLFRKHIKEMKEIASSQSEKEARIVLLTKENNKLLKNQTEYDEKIQSQQKIQYDVEQKYNELYSMKVEGEKMKQDLSVNDALNKEIESIDLAIDTMSNLSDEIQVAFGTHLNKTASRYIYGLTNGKYDSLNVDNSLNITINYDGKVIPLSKISSGTVDQIYLAMRLASYDLIKGNRESLPILFDDCFAMYDNERIEASLKYLNETINSQMIIFTCHTREVAYLEHLKILFNRVAL